MNEIRTPRRRVTHRATLAPDRPFGQWTVADFRQFVRDCDAMGIPDDALAYRDKSEWTFANAGGPLIAERHVSLD